MTCTQQPIGENNDDKQQVVRDSSLTANYVTENYTFYPTTIVESSTINNNGNANDSHDDGDVSIQVRSATTTVGGNIISDRSDLTGIMIWPATYLLCQHCAFNTVGDYVLELGCGCGMVGAVALTKANKSTKRAGSSLWVSTDRDESALEMCRSNLALNGIAVQGNENQMDTNSSNSNAWIRSLEWGDESDIQKLLTDLQTRDPATPNRKFDALVAADIVYPATCGQIMLALFQTVDRLLATEGTLWLSFCSRDGANTPRKLLEAASDAGFSVRALPPLDATDKAKLPPLLDAKILLLTRDVDARHHNDTLGGEECAVFRGLRAAMARMDEPSSSEEEWDPPYCEDEMTDED
jgi:predicted nicotinamide N-methyase